MYPLWRIEYDGGFFLGFSVAFTATALANPLTDVDWFVPNLGPMFGNPMELSLLQRSRSAS